MAFISNTFRPFSEQSLEKYLALALENASKEIDTQGEKYIQSVSPDEYLAYLEEKAYSPPPSFDLLGITQSPYRKFIPSKLFPQSFFVEPGEKYEKTVFAIHVPFSGDQKILHYRASTYLWSALPEMWIDGSEICFEIISFDDQNVSEVRRQMDEVVKNLSELLGFSVSDINKYNAELKKRLGERLEKRKLEISKREALSFSLGIPVKNPADAPKTWDIPSPITAKRIAPEQPSQEKPNPTLSKEDYGKILKTVHDWGKQMESLPSTYSGKDEPALRDTLLMILQSHTTASATGESYNKSGKTDILLKFENANIFVAECKIWSGQSEMQKAITQLLNYLTWRDTKTALIFFVKDQIIKKTISTAKESAPSHPCYLGLIQEVADSWIEYKFKLTPESDQDVYITFLFFHLPEDRKK